MHYGGSIAYLPILDILRSYFEIKEGEQEFPLKRKTKEKISQLDEKLETVLPPIQELLSLRVDDEVYLKLEPKQKREKIFEAIRDLYIRESQKKPLVLVFEDLHWIDKTSEEFLDYFIGWLANTPILLVLLYRPEYTHRWASKSYYINIRVDQLSLPTSAELVQSILSEGEIASELRELILNKAAGNPLFMEELTHTLLENGTIQREGNHYLLSRKPSDIQVPDTIQGIIAARMDRLEESLKRIMQVASVIGREFVFRILQAIMEMKEELKSHLLNLQNLEFIYEKRLFPELEYIFKHALTQEVAYNSLLLKRRKEIHEKIGGAIEEIYSDRLGEFYEMLAYHYTKSDNLEKAYQYLKLSGNKAMRSYSPTEAFRFYRDAINILKQMGETDQNKKEQIEIILSMAGPMRLLAYPEDSFKFLQEGETLSKDLEDKKSLAILYSHVGSFYSTKGEAVLGMKYEEDSFGEAEKLQDSEMIVRIGANLCISYDYAGEYRKIVQIAPRIMALLERTSEMFEFLGSPVDLRPGLHGLYGHALGYIGKFAQGEEVCEKALSLAQEGDNLYTMGYVEFFYGCMFVPKGDGENAVKHLQRSVEYFEKLQAYVVLPVTLSLLGMGYYLRGDPGKALGLLEKGLKMRNYTEVPGFLSLQHLTLSSAHLGLGNLHEARVHAERALHLGQTNHERYCEGISWIQLGRTAGKMEKSSIEKAEEYILKGMKILGELETKPAYAQGCLSLGGLYAEAGQKEKALESLKKAEAMFQEMGMEFWLAQTKKLLEP
jgi:tetratricopeptide (TPR) repeat protein